MFCFLKTELHRGSTTSGTPAPIEACTLFSDGFTDLNLTDMESSYKVFTRRVLKQITIEEDRFGFEPEIVAKVARLRCRVYEVDISYAGRTYDEGQKIRWTDGVRALWCIVKYSCARRPGP